MTRMLIFAVMLSALFTTAAHAEDIALAHQVDNAMADVNEIISMRSELAKEFIKPGSEVTEETFKKVCGRVGKKLAEINEGSAYKLKHAAIKWRNSKHAATAGEEALISRFLKDKGLAEISDEVNRDGKRFVRYAKPIYVEKSCLACHGEKDARPAFIVEKYPEDKAYGFKEGDFRGVIYALVPAE